MFNALSIISDSLALPSGSNPGRTMPEPARPRTANSTRRPMSFKATSFAGRLSLVTDAIIPPPPPPRAQSQPRPRPNSVAIRSRAAQRDSILSTTSRRPMTVKEEPEPRSDSSEMQRELVYRWDGIIGARSEWEAMRRDHELWTPEGDATVHFYAAGQSRRGPSIRLAFVDIERSHCSSLLAEACVRSPNGWELYVPLPPNQPRSETYRYHLTTRNLFAWMLDRPLVGAQLGPSLIALHERLDVARPDAKRNADELLAYIEGQGYADFRDNPDHAVAALVYAERFEVADLWIDAFVHCVGMHDQLAACLDWASITPTTKALLARASCEMQVRLERASMELTSFMEEPLSRLGLPDDITRHLDRFRSFLNSFYVEKMGYWPPPAESTSSNTLSKAMLRTLYTDFRSLYELLVDQTSTAERSSSISDSTTSGHSSGSGASKFDIAASIHAFDRRHRYTALPFTLPLLPTNIPPEADSRFSYILPGFSSAKRARTGRRAAIVSSLQQATNLSDGESALVAAYRDFEREFTLAGEERLAPATARTARWLLVYAALQTLADVTRAPPEVHDIDGVAYPLCCQTAGTPPWSEAANATTEPNSPTRTEPRAASPAPSALVAPLDLARVATKKRQSLVAAADGLDVKTPTTPLHAPIPRRPSALLTAYDPANEAVDDDDDDVPSLSPTSDRHSHRSSTDSGDETAHTPTSATASRDDYFDRSSMHQDDDDLERARPVAPPSPSIYEEADDRSLRNRSEFDLLAAAAAGKAPGSEELAARWRGEIGSPAFP